MLPVTEDSKLTHFKRPAGPKNRKRPDANNRREKVRKSHFRRPRDQLIT